MRYLILDVESHAITDAATYLTEPVDAPSNYKDPEKIKAYIEEAKKAQIAKAALDVDLARLVAFGYREATDAGVNQTFLLKDETQEMTFLGQFFSEFFPSGNTVDWPVLVTFNGMGFDLPLILRRAMYLGVKAPKIQIDRFKHPNVLDLMTILNLDGRLKTRGLQFYCNRLKIQVDDESTGADIAALIAKDDWHAVECHCSSDLSATYALAKRMGVLS
jgi:hypothetical protein